MTDEFEDLDLKRFIVAATFIISPIIAPLETLHV